MIPADRPADETPTPGGGAVPEDASQALRALLAPLARLALAQGLTHATLDELLKQALVQAADDALAASTTLPAHRRVSRITTTTGIHRREVTRLAALLREGGLGEPPVQRSHASELFVHWRTHAEFCDRRGSPRELPRQGPSPSFEALARSVTRDVHPRSLLDELLRLGQAAWDRDRDTVRLVRESFVPQGESGRMLRTLGANVGSHLEAAVDNLLIDPGCHLEQALYAPALSAASLAEWRALVRDQWQAVLGGMLPRLEALAVRDAARPVAPGEERYRVRLGMYHHQRGLPPAPSPAPARRAAAAPAAPSDPSDPANP